MRFVSNLFSVAIYVLILSNSISAHFFPNVSAIPPSLIPNATKTAWNSFHKFAGCHRGEKLDGLARLKEYFHRFGYIPDISSNYTDEFDDSLESAIKTYQRNFNLNATGQLDESTINQIVRPRCGVADIVNGSTSMNSGKTNTSFHTVAHYTTFPGRPSWPSSKFDLTYAFLPANQLSDSVKALFTKAFDRWSAVTPLTFSQTTSYNDADIRIAFYSGDHGDGEPFDGVLGTLAHAFSPTSGRLHLDGDENWVTADITTVTSSSTAVDLESVAVHEIGHLLGLGHSSVEDAIMYPTISSGTRKVELASDDIQGVQDLYGSNPNYNGTSAPANQERETNGAHTVGVRWRLEVLMAAALVLLLL